MSGRTCLSPSRVELGVSKDYHIWNIMMYKNAKSDLVWDSTLPKICIIWENTSNKSCSTLNSLKKKSVVAHVLSPSGLEAGGSTDWHLWNIIMHKNGKVDSVQGSTLPKIHIIFLWHAKFEWNMKSVWWVFHISWYVSQKRSWKIRKIWNTIRV